MLAGRCRLHRFFMNFIDSSRGSALGPVDCAAGIAAIPHLRRMATRAGLMYAEGEIRGACSHEVFTV